jgi:hypothetical protein
MILFTLFAIAQNVSSERIFGSLETGASFSQKAQWAACLLTGVPPVLLFTKRHVAGRKLRRNTDVIQERELPTLHVGTDGQILNGGNGRP